MNSNFENIFGNLFGNNIFKQEKECCNNCGHCYIENSRHKCRLFKDAKPYPNDDKCVFYVKKKES